MVRVKKPIASSSHPQIPPLALAFDAGVKAPQWVASTCAKKYVLYAKNALAISIQAPSENEPASSTPVCHFFPKRTTLFPLYRTPYCQRARSKRPAEMPAPSPGLASSSASASSATSSSGSAGSSAAGSASMADAVVGSSSSTPTPTPTATPTATPSWNSSAVNASSSANATADDDAFTSAYGSESGSSYASLMYRRTEGSCAFYPVDDAGCRAPRSCFDCLNYNVAPERAVRIMHGTSSCR